MLYTDKSRFPDAREQARLLALKGGCCIFAEMSARFSHRYKLDLQSSIDNRTVLLLRLDAGIFFPVWQFPGGYLDIRFMDIIKLLYDRNVHPWQQMVFYHCPPQLPAACVQEIEKAAITIFRALGCRDVARLDFRIDGNSCVYFLEANPLPGLGDYSDLPIMTALAGWDYSRLLKTILNSALERYGLLLPRHAHSTSL